MNKLSLLISLIIFSFTVSAFSQVSNIIEKVENEKYKITFDSPAIEYNIQQLSNRKEISFPGFVDENSPGTFVLPRKDLFIAIPPNSNPTIKLKILSSEFIDAIPAINPSVKSFNDSVVTYEAVDKPIKINSGTNYKVKGKLWIGNNYCVQVQVKLFDFDNYNRKVIKYNKFEISLTFKSNLATLHKKISSHEEISPLIINPGLAANYFGKPQFPINDTGSWIDYNKDYLKIGTALNSIYKITPNELASFNVSVSSIDPRSFKMFKNGNEIPIYVKGEDDGIFNDSDYVEFVGERNYGGHHRELSAFGQPYNEYLGRYTDTTVYWLTWTGENGMRVKLVTSNNLITTDTLKYYDEIIHLEFNNWFDFSMEDLVRRESPFWYENNTWSEGNLGVGTKNKNFTLSDIYPGKPVEVFEKLQDYASNLIADAHILSISLNNEPVQDSGYIDKYQKTVLMGKYNSDVLKEGTNTVKIHSYTTNSNPNLCILDWTEIEYPRYIKAINDSLLFFFPFLTSKKNNTVKIQNLSGDNFSIWKYGDTYAKYFAAKSNNEIIIQDTIGPADKFVILNENNLKTPKLYYVKKFRNLRSSQNKADYIAITHKKFIKQVEQYANFIAQNYNVTTTVVDVDDIYDEFSYGQFNPECIKDFLKTTHNNWQQPLPKYVALIGGATYDYNRNKTIFQHNPPVDNYVPSFGVPVSDNWFVSWDTTNAYVPEMNVGRIPVTTTDEFQRYFEKHQNYVSQKIDAWNKRFIFFSGGTGDNQSQIDQLRDVNQYVIDNYVAPPPVSGSYTHFYKTINPTTNFGPYTNEEFQSAIQKGGLFISYLGHSGTQTWDNTITQPSQLKNNLNRYPLISDFGCSTARFAEPDIKSFSQLFVLDPEGQAIAYIGNASLGFLSTATTAPKLFYKELLADSVYNISEALKLAKLDMLQQYGSSGVYQLFALTNTLIGDPIINLQLPSKPDLSISSSDVTYNISQLTDQVDSINVKIIYHNFGSTNSDSIKILVKDEFSGGTDFSKTFKRKMPSLNDSLFVTIPTNNLPGEHDLSINLDTDNSIDEINEANNSIVIKLNVASSTLRSYYGYSVDQESNGKIKIINPTLNPLSEKIVLQLSKSEDFSSPQEISKDFDTLVTNIDVTSLINSGRYYFRGKILGANDFNAEQSFYLGIKNRYLLSDSVSFATAEMTNLKYMNNAVQLDSSRINISVLSAGFNDGNSAIIARNDETLIPENTLSGHHICVFKDSTFKFIEYKRFDVQLGGQVITDYINFLDTLSSNYLIAVAISNNGPISSQDLKNELKSFGSIYIDSVVFRGSWAFIGKKGAKPGSMPETFSKPFGGRVRVDTTINKTVDTGYFVTSKIGPSASWENIEVQSSLPGDSKIMLKPLGVKEDGTIDSLNNLNITNNQSDISFIDSKKYPYLKFVSKIDASTNHQTPMLNSLAVEYKKSAELALNYQTVSISSDSINAGGDVNLNFNTYNIGEVPADSFKVTVNVIKPDQSSEKILDKLITQLNPNSKLSYNLNYNPGTKFGSFQFLINVDPDKKVDELYKDNNTFEIPFYVIPDTTNLLISEKSFSVKYDGKEVVDGDYISSTPEITMILNYPVWYSPDDTSAIQFWLDDEKIYSNEMATTIDAANKIETFKYNPVLTNGDHNFKVFGYNINSELESTPGYQKSFMVSNEMDLMQVYNFPNPFANKTFFTFKLTQIPDNLKINIYTIAGRLIKQIEKSSAQLNYDLNKIEWNGRDADGDMIANGTYLYKVIIQKGEKSQNVTQKLSIIR